MSNYGMSMNYTHFSLPNLNRSMVASEIPVKYLRYKRSYKHYLHSAIYQRWLPVDQNCLLYIEPPSLLSKIKKDDGDLFQGIPSLMIYPDETFARSRYKADPGRYRPLSPDWDYKIHQSCYTKNRHNDPLFFMSFCFHLFEFVDNTSDTSLYGIKVHQEVLLNNKVYKPLEAIKCGNMFDKNFERHSNIYKDRRVACLMPPTAYYYDSSVNRSIIAPLVINSLGGTSFSTIISNDIEKKGLYYMPSHRQIQSGEIYLDIIDVSHLPNYNDIPDL
jgi:hypothetical protein|nr:MAG TPA: hypothetical protein [Caudoviricetes sp.]